MQVSSLPLSGLPMPSGSLTRGQEANDQETSPRRSLVNATRGVSLPSSSDDATRLTLSSAAQASVGDQPFARPQAPGAVYAEIWKDGVRIATVHTNGVVTPALGLTWHAVAGDDPGVAQRRADELARAVGGEVRYVSNNERANEASPPPVDARTERMRARLRAAYGL